MSKNKHFQDINVNILHDENNSLLLEAEPFERGYGVTLGNSLRRILLTSLPGAAITSIKIDGHEHVTLDCSPEDVEDILLSVDNFAASV